jgi:anti-sigma factor RsiW
MTCREAATLLPRFFDGELDPHKMRLVALHSTRCTACEGELRLLEHVQELLCERVNAALDTVDFAEFWPAIERQLGTARVSWWESLQIWWAEADHGWLIRLPAYAAATAIVVLSLLYGARYLDLPGRPEPQQFAADNLTAQIHRLASDVDVTVINDPDTTLLWIDDVARGD